MEKSEAFDILVPGAIFSSEKARQTTWSAADCYLLHQPWDRLLEWFSIGRVQVIEPWAYVLFLWVVGAVGVKADGSEMTYQTPAKNLSGKEEGDLSNQQQIHSSFGKKIIMDTVPTNICDEHMMW